MAQAAAQAAIMRTQAVLATILFLARLRQLAVAAVLALTAFRLEAMAVLAVAVRMWLRQAAQEPLDKAIMVALAQPALAVAAAVVAHLLLEQMHLLA